MNKQRSHPPNHRQNLFFVNLKPIWIQSWGYFLVLACGSGAINGLLARLGWIQAHQVSPLYRNEFILPCLWFLLGLGLGMFLVPRIIYHHQAKSPELEADQERGSLE
ncbi:MAG: hypothetical protein F6J87_08675 [Spirulina sp. SIO3F2]|nr:hypothetical protein [Spirulina sp. SIO3F2]